ncbi:MAG: uncharacterized protein FD135_5118 [Comamonadaceae bacterium]|nr:MAG: uncharacterized protein FD135_5118 [Comamonadaceae bacterium]
MLAMNQESIPATSETQDALLLKAPEPLSADEFAELNAILSYLRARDAAIPVWEFCEGFMAALICCRRQIAPEEYLPVLLTTPFANAVQQQHFMSLWTRRWQQVSQALDSKITALDDAAAYQPELLDARAEHAALPEAERVALAANPIPSFAQRWAQGFMAAVAAWPEEWAGPRNKEALKWRTAALEFVTALTPDDTDSPELRPFTDETGPPTVSSQRMKAFGDAIWAVYNIREMWLKLGPRIETVLKPATPGRNEPCACGSGKKYKKCCGA